ncbi:MAG: class I tRNA ligase family protein, partial [Microthrixaceae bacterium]
IIRTWLFSTVLRSKYEHDSVPWANVALSGWILDPDRKKMSKSKGNVVVPTHLLEAHGADGVRYWSGSARPGTDTTFDEAQMKVGRRLSIKLLNASKFALSFGEGSVGEGSVGEGSSSEGSVSKTENNQLLLQSSAITEPLDRAMVATLAKLVADATAAFESFDYARALERTEQFFWPFCDDYLELVKGRAYGNEGEEPNLATLSARASLVLALSTLHRLFAPFLPFTTEEVWSWWMEGSVHRSEWPAADELQLIAADGNPAALELAAQVLSELRGAKSAAKVRMGSPIQQATVSDTAERLALLSTVVGDVAEAGKVEELLTETAETLSVQTKIEPLST